MLTHKYLYNDIEQQIVVGKDIALLEGHEKEIMIHLLCFLLKFVYYCCLNYYFVFSIKLKRVKTNTLYMINTINIGFRI